MCVRRNRALYESMIVSSNLMEKRLCVTSTYSLQKFEFRGRAPSCLKSHWELQKKRSRVRQVTEYEHQCLKVVEFIGWVGLTPDFELAMCLLESVVSLEKMIIDTRNPSFRKTWDFREQETTNIGREAAIERARQLEAKRPPHAELVIL
ncbi:uncharacterized protein LOC132294931 [Cornus florida]|uniref:uncharacterized protein LOC132294931 n=1 Tax=Cornus florida TaxID=4283 RepID=UPI00289893AB|nr:uncharacterized protein LOC132294931 [Cornus florida]